MGVESAATGQERTGQGTSRPDLARTMKLPDGRTLGYAEYGPKDAPALFLFHGLPGSRLAVEELWPGPSAATTTASATSEGDTRDADGSDGGPGQVRVIAPDRPGMGLSDHQPGRRISDWAADVAALADALELSRRIAEQVPGAALTVYPREGHLFSTRHWDEIRDTLIADLKQQ